MIRFRFLLLLVLMSTGAVVNSGIAEPSASELRPLGLIPPGEEELAEGIARSQATIRRITERQAPPAAATVDFRWLPPVGTQLYGNCGAWPGAYYMKTYYEAREHGWEHPSPDTHPEHVMSVAFPYALEYTPSLQGSSPTFIADMLKTYGTTPWSVRPESSGYEAPIEEEWRAAAPYRIADWYYVDLTTETGRTQAKTLITENNPLGTAWSSTTGNIDSYTGADADGVSNGVLYAYSDWGDQERISMGHAVTIIGYDDNKAYLENGEPRQGAWLVVNQWGTNWGVAAETGGTRGYMWIAYPMLTYAQAFEDRIDYQPKDFFVYHIRADIPAYVDVTLIHGDPLAPVFTLPMFDFHSLNSWDTTIAQDITDWRPLIMEWGWRLSLFSVSATNAGSVRWPPEILSASLEVDGYEGIPFGGMPLSGVNLATVYVDQAPNVRDDGRLSGLPLITSGHAFWVNWNADERDDLYIAGISSLNLAQQGIYEPTFNTVYTASGSGIYDMEPMPGVPYGETSVIMDFDGNGRADIMVPGQDNSCTIELWLQDTGGRLAHVGSVIEDRCYSLLSGVDFDNDGDGDVLVSAGHYVGQDWIQESRIWLNDGASRFTESTVAAPHITRYAIWADFDQDGWNDAVLDDVVYRNGEGGFLVPAGSLPAACWSIAAGDFNSDGRIDLACLSDGQSLLLRNDGGFTFSVAASLGGYPQFGIVPNAVFLGDFDGDGIVDVTKSGITGWSITHQRRPREVAFHRQASDGTFSRPGLIFPPLSDGIILGGDFDDDGDMDIYASGQRTVAYDEPSPAFQPWDSACYRNALTELMGAARNTPPAKPTGLSAAVVDAENGAVDISWSPPIDAEELSSLALGYRLRVGSTPGGNQVVSDAAVRKREGLWLAPGTAGRRLRGLPPGTYHWAVRAVDSSWVAGPWSDEHTFTIGPPSSRGDANSDTFADAADILFMRDAVNLGTPISLAAGDFDANGRIDDVDLSGLPSILVCNPWMSATIGASGGTISTKGFRLTIPPGCFVSPQPLIVAQSRQNPLGEDTSPLAFQVQGLPVVYNTPIRIDLLPAAVPPTHVLLGEDAFRSSSGTTVTAWRPLLATLGPDEWVSVVLPPITPDGKQATRQAANTQTLQLVLAEITVEGNDRWRITLPVNYLTLHGRITKALDAAYDKYQQAPFAFDYSMRTAWPMDVIFRSLAEDGGHVNSMWGINYNYIELHSKFLANPDGNSVDPSLECVIGHEFFHFVQSMYDPRSSYARAKSPSRHYWVDEMTATWAETLFASSSAYIPSLVETYRDAPLAGLPHPEDSPSSSPLQLRRHGYGMAPLCKWIVERHGAGVIRTTYEQIRSGKQPLTALSTSLYAGAPDNQIWWSSFAAEWMDDEKLFHYGGHLLRGLPDADFPAFTGSNRLIQLAQPGRQGVHLALPARPHGLSGIVIANLQPAQSLLDPPGTELMIRLKDPTRTLGLGIAVLDPQEPSIPILSTRLSLDVLRADIPNMKTLAEKNSYIAATVTNTSSTPVDKAAADVYILYNGTQEVFPATCGVIRLAGSRFPEYRVSGTIEVKKAGAIEKSDVYGYQSSFLAVVWPLKTEDFHANLSIDRLTADTHSFVYGNERFEYEMAGAPSYKIIRRNRDYTTIYAETPSSSPSITLTVDPAKNYQLYDVAIVVPVRERVYNATTNTLTRESITVESIGCFSALLLIGDHNWEELQEDPFDPTAQAAPSTADIRNFMHE